MAKKGRDRNEGFRVVTVGLSVGDLHYETKIQKLLLLVLLESKSKLKIKK